MAFDLAIEYENERRNGKAFDYLLLDDDGNGGKDALLQVLCDLGAAEAKSLLHKFFVRSVDRRVELIRLQNRYDALDADFEYFKHQVNNVMIHKYQLKIQKYKQVIHNKDHEHSRKLRALESTIRSLESEKENLEESNKLLRKHYRETRSLVLKPEDQSHSTDSPRRKVTSRSKDSVEESRTTNKVRVKNENKKLVISAKKNNAFDNPTFTAAPEKKLSRYHARSERK